MVTEKYISLLDTLHLLLANDGALNDNYQAILKRLQQEALWYGQERERLEQKLSDFVRTATAWADLGVIFRQPVRRRNYLIEPFFSLIS